MTQTKSNRYIPDIAFRTHCSHGCGICDDCLLWRAQDIAALYDFQRQQIYAHPLAYWRAQIPGGEFAKDERAPSLRHLALVECGKYDQPQGEALSYYAFALAEQCGFREERVIDLLQTDQGALAEESIAFCTGARLVRECKPKPSFQDEHWELLGLIGLVALLTIAYFSGALNLIGGK